MKTIALLGATGKAGAYILNELLNGGYSVKALVRNQSQIFPVHSNLTLVQGDAGDYLSINELLANCQVVVSALGQRPGEPLIAAIAVKHIIKVMQQHNIRRYIFLSGLNIDVAGDLKSMATAAKSDWMRQHYPDAVADKQSAYELVAKTNLLWTMLRLPMINQGDERRGYQLNLYDSPGELINAADLAELVVQQIEDDTLYFKAPFVASI